MSVKLVEEVYEDINLPSSEKSLLAFMAFRANNDGTSIFPGLESTMKAINLKKWQTQKLLRSLREKGYIVAINHAGGRKHFTSYYIPLDQFGHIFPRPMHPDAIAEQRAKYSRKGKKASQAQPPDDDFPDFDQADQPGANEEDQPPAEQAESPEEQQKPEPATRAQQQPRFPAVAAAISTALVPVPAPIPITPAPAPLSPQERTLREYQKYIKEWTDQVHFYQYRRDQQPPDSRGWKRWDTHYQDAMAELNAWNDLTAKLVAAMAVVETPGEYA